MVTSRKVQVYATTGGYIDGKVWRSEDGGATRTNITANLPRWLPVHTILLDPRNPERLFIGTEAGVWIGEPSLFGIWHWARYGDSMPNVQVTDLQTQLYPDGTRVVVAATYGRGAWSIPLRALNAGALGNRVWHDTNPNGIQDAGEPGLANVAVVLLDQFDNWVADTLTDAGGAYRFEHLEAGSYYLVFGVPDGFAFTGQDQGGDDTRDSDVNPQLGQTGLISLSVGQADLSVDAGLRAGNFGWASVGDRVWDDLDKDGIQDAGEPGLADVTVNLLDANDQVIATTTTDALGDYWFAAVAAGTYRLEFLPLPGYGFSPQDQGGDDAIDSDPDSTTGRTFLFTMTGAAGEWDFDAGLVGGDVATGEARPEPDADTDPFTLSPPLGQPPSGGKFGLAGW